MVQPPSSNNWWLSNIITVSTNIQNPMIDHMFKSEIAYGDFPPSDTPSMEHLENLNTYLVPPRTPSEQLHRSGAILWSLQIVKVICVNIKMPQDVNPANTKRAARYQELGRTVSGWRYRYKLLAHVTTLLHIGLHWNIIEYLQKMDPILLAGWWFGTWILFFHSVGNGKSSQLTKS